MCSRFRTEALLAALLAGASAPGARAAAWTICAEPDQLPFAQESSHSGVELDVAALIAKDLGRPLAVRWVTQRDPSYFRQTIDAGACDAIMSVPVGMRRLATTRPWYHAGFVFVARAGLRAPSSFDASELDHRSIAVPATGLGETPPSLALVRRGLAARLRPFSIYDPRATLQAVARGDVDLAVLWGPFARWWAARDGARVDLRATPERDGAVPLAFDLAIGVRKGDEASRALLDGVLARHQPEIDRLLRRWHVTDGGG
jgi:mxaJ protein